MTTVGRRDVNLNVELPPAPPERTPPPPAPTKEKRPGWQRWLFFAVAAGAASAFLTYVVAPRVNDTRATTDTPAVSDTPTAVASDGCFNAEAFFAYNDEAVAAFEEAGKAELSADTTGMINALDDARRAWVMMNGLVDDGVYPELHFHTDLIVKSLTWAVDAINVAGGPTVGQMNKAAMLISSAGREMNAAWNTMESTWPRGGAC